MKEGEIHAVIAGVPMLIGKVGDDSLVIAGVTYKKQDISEHATTE